MKRTALPALVLAAMASGAPLSARFGAAPQPAPAGPILVSPFPSGLSGQLVFQSDSGGPASIYTLDLARGVLARLTKGAVDDAEPVWSPDGQRIAFASNRSDPRARAHDIYVMNANGTGAERLTTDRSDERDAAWAPDGKSVYFTGERDGRAEIYRVWLHNTQVDRVTSGLDRATLPAISPDGRELAYAAQLLISYQLHLLDLKTGGDRRLTSGSGACRPRWSPNGTRLAYVELAADKSRIDVMTVSSGRVQTIVDDPRRWAYFPTWSPDGSRLAFSLSPEHDAGENWDLAVVELAQPSRLIRLTKGAANDRMPDWKR